MKHNIDLILGAMLTLVASIGGYFWLRAQAINPNAALWDQTAVLSPGQQVLGMALVGAIAFGVVSTANGVLNTATER